MQVHNTSIRIFASNEKADQNINLFSQRIFNKNENRLDFSRILDRHFFVTV
jgi:hypothetical protein